MFLYGFDSENVNNALMQIFNLTKFYFNFTLLRHDKHNNRIPKYL